ncbi:hypothetical protein, partial [Cloacibacillus porcorum]
SFGGLGYFCKLAITFAIHPGKSRVNYKNKRRPERSGQLFPLCFFAPRVTTKTQHRQARTSPA